MSLSQKDGNANKKVQDAHEAIRPTYFTLPPVKVKESLARDQFRLYQLVWNRFLASRMSDAIYEITSVKIEAAGYLFTLAASKVKFEGFLSVYKQDDEKEEKNVLSKKLTADSELKLEETEPKQHFTQPPAHIRKLHSKAAESLVSDVRVRMLRQLQQLLPAAMWLRKIKICMSQSLARLLTTL